MLAGGVWTAEACPAGTFSTNGTACESCPNGLMTENRASISKAACLAGPDFGYYPNGADNNPVTTADLAGAKMIKCPLGSYKGGWNLSPCVACGVDISTDVSETNGLGLSSEQCITPAGWGTTISAITKKLRAAPCRNGKFGSDSPTYGIHPSPCQVFL